MSQHTTFKRSAEGRAQTRNRRTMRALKYRQTSVTEYTYAVPMGA